jgi:hypothetical protein
MRFGRRLGLAADEHVKWSKWVGNMQNGRLAGGHLLVTDQRLVFKPMPWERLLGASGVSVSLDEIRAVTLAPPETIPANLRSVLRVHLRSGSDKLFECHGVHRAAENLAKTTGHSLAVDHRLPPANLDPLSSKRRGLEAAAPVFTLLLLALAIETNDVITWVAVAVGLLWCAGFLRIRYSAKKRKVQ